MQTIYSQERSRQFHIFRPSFWCIFKRMKMTPFFTWFSCFLFLPFHFTCACLNVGTATIWYHELLLLLSFLYATSAFNTDVENHYSQLHSVEVEWKINIIVHVLIKLPLGIVLMMFLLQVKSNNHFAPVWPWTYFEKPHFFCIKQLSVK